MCWQLSPAAMHRAVEPQTAAWALLESREGPATARKTWIKAHNLHRSKVAMSRLDQYLVPEKSHELWLRHKPSRYISRAINVRPGNTVPSVLGAFGLAHLIVVRGKDADLAY